MHPRARRIIIHHSIPSASERFQNPLKKRFPARKGFSLVELLVVMLVVVVLAGIVFTLASRMKKSANKSITVCYMRQIGAAMITYNPDRAAILVQWYSVNNTLGQGAHAYSGNGAPANLLKPCQQVLCRWSRRGSGRGHVRD